MTSLLRQIVAGPRAKHAETGLDLCYVTDEIIVTSGPSQTYPQRAYRNPLDRLVTFLDAKHGDNWAIWEFRAEGTGYPDEAVYGRVRHYPWPDHHPPPFRLIPMIVASMRNWLEGLDDPAAGKIIDEGGELKGPATGQEAVYKDSKNKRVVVVHCKAGKGRSGTATCSYLISQCGWKAEDALARFTERRMRPKFGAGVSIPSQLRWISYVDRWTRGGKKYIDREVEILEVHVWGLRHGVKVTIEGFEDEGKKIRVLHTFKKEERHVVQGDAPGGGGVMDFLGDALSPPVEEDEVNEEVDYNEIVGGGDKVGDDAHSNGSGTSSPTTSQSKKDSRMSLLSGKPSRNSSFRKLDANPRSKTINPADFSSPSSASSAINLSAPNTNASEPSLSTSSTMADTNEPGGMAVILKPTTPIRIPNSDVCISLERRNRAPSSMGFTMVTAVAHVWFNAFFEGRGPEQDGEADGSGVFEIEWDKMDGLKGSSRKGTRAANRISVVWKAVDTPGPVPVVNEPGEGSPVPQMRPANWKGETDDVPQAGLKLGLRTEESGSEGVSTASSIKSQEMGTEKDSEAAAAYAKSSDDESLKGVKSSDPLGGDLHHDMSDHERKVEATKGRTSNPDEASGSTVSEEQLLAAATAPIREARAGKPSETATKQKEAEEEATKAIEAERQEEHHEGGEHKHGFVKLGKKLLPTHHKSTGDDGKDTRLMDVSVKK